MSKFRSSHRTVVTELKAFIVDTVSRTGAFRQSVSAKVPDDGALLTQDVNVSRTQVFEISNTRGVLGILCPEPVKLMLTQTGEGDFTPEEPVAPQYTDGVITAPLTHIAGNPLVVSVTDPDLLQSQTQLSILAFNTVTGETETANLVRMSEDTFTGVLQTQISTEKGGDFDGIMYAAHDQLVRLIYRDNTSSSGSPKGIEAQVVMKSPYTDSEITVNPFLFVGKPTTAIVVDADITGAIGAFATVTNLNTGEVERMDLTEIESGVFAGRIDTQSMGTPVDNDGIMDVEVGHVLEVSFTDEHSTSAPVQTALIEVHETQNVNGVLTVSSEVTTSGVLSVVLTDYNLSGSAYVDVPVSNTRTGEFEMVTCRERVLGSGSFIGSLQMKLGSSGSSDGELGAEAGDTLRAVYIDGSSESGGPYVVEEFVNVVADPVVSTTTEDPAPADETEDTTDPYVERTIEILVNGLFFFNGEFVGNAKITGLRDELTRCSVLHV